MPPDPWQVLIDTWAPVAIRLLASDTGCPLPDWTYPVPKLNLATCAQLGVGGKGASSLKTILPARGLLFKCAKLSGRYPQEWASQEFHGKLLSSCKSSQASPDAPMDQDTGHTELQFILLSTTIATCCALTLWSYTISYYEDSLYQKSMYFYHCCLLAVKLDRTRV